METGIRSLIHGCMALMFFIVGRPVPAGRDARQQQQDGVLASSLGQPTTIHPAITSMDADPKMAAPQVQSVESLLPGSSNEEKDEPFGQAELGETSEIEQDIWQWEDEEDLDATCQETFNCSIADFRGSVSLNGAVDPAAASASSSPGRPSTTLPSTGRIADMVRQTAAKSVESRLSASTSGAQKVKSSIERAPSAGEISETCIDHQSRKYYHL